ncbi:MAG: HDOD domain-containing protein [Methylomicrobium sp.]|nr:HDOD domain-containing protein [Methylomicrobium sp.]
MPQLTAKTLIKGALDLCSLPDIYFQIREMIRDPRFSMNDIGLVLAKDPALSIRVLKIVNSSFYGFPARVDTISRAVTIIGIDDLESLILATSVVDTFKKIPSEIINMTDFWMRSVSCALIAKLLAKKSAILHSDRLFLAGLLHNIGALVIYQKLPEKACRILMLAQGDRCLITGLEQEIMGFNYAEVGAELIHDWGLPDSLAETIRWQLNPCAAQTNKTDAHLLYLAVKLTDMVDMDTNVEEVLSAAPDSTLRTLGLTEFQVKQAVSLAVDEFKSTFDLLSPGKKFH